MTRIQRIASGLLLAAAAAGLWLFLAPPALGGQFAVVTTHGTSMKPRFSTGDLAIVHRQDGYRTGDVVAYNSAVLGRVVMHRIIADDAGTFVFQGDNNDYADPDRPTKQDCIGKLAVRVPQGGLWLHRATSPVAVALALAVLLGAFAPHVHPHRRRTVSRHALTPRRRLTLRRGVGHRASNWAPLAAVGLTTLAATAWAWTAPATASSVLQQRQTSTVSFAYSTQVAVSAAYPSGLITQPDPVFRKVSNRVRVTYHYRGLPGQVQVDARLRADSGWHTTVPLSGPTELTDDHTGSVLLDLNALDARSKAAAAVIGVSADQLSISVVPRFSAPHQVFAPELSFTMTEARLALAGDSASLSATTTSRRPVTVMAPRVFTVGSVSVSMAQLRYLSIGLLGLTVIAGLWRGLRSRRDSLIGESALIQRKYGQLLLEVEPVPAVPGRPLVDVTRFVTLTKLCERYGLLVLHWSRSGVDTFIVQDQSTTYRYRTGHVHSRVPGANQAAASGHEPAGVGQAP